MQQAVKQSVLVLGFLGLLLVRPSHAYLMNQKQISTVHLLLGAVYTYHPKPIGSWEALSEQLYEAYTTDPDTRRLFWRSDYEVLSRHRKRLDDQLRYPQGGASALVSDYLKQISQRPSQSVFGERKNLAFLSDYVAVVRKRSKESIEMLRGMLEADWEYGSADFYDPNPMGWPVPTNAFVAERAWETFVKYEVLRAYYNQQSKLSSLAAYNEEDNIELLRELSTSPDREEDFWASEFKNRRKVIQQNIKRLEALHEAPMEQWFNAFLRKLVFAYDPHSKLFLRPGQSVESVYSNTSKPRSIPPNQVEGYKETLRGEGSSGVVRPGRVNFSLVRSHPNNPAAPTFGYLGFNAFYSNKKTSVAQRVFEVLKHFNREQTKGLVLDLRNNPGGYLPQALKILGYFLGKKPAVYTFMTEKSLTTQLTTAGKTKDDVSVKSYPERSSGIANYCTYVEVATADQVYQKPLVVLVNERTGSAGELTASVLQDYGRAVVVGSPRTFGKGTGQVLFTYQNTPTNPTMRLNLTVLVYYSVNGRSVQGDGLVPDIVLPSAFYQLGGFLEGDLFNVIDPVPIETEVEIDDGVGGLLGALLAASGERTLKSPYFQYIRGASQSMGSKVDHEQIPLGYKKYMGYQYRNERWRRGLAGLQGVLPKSFEALASPTNKGRPRGVPPESFLRALERDPYVAESVVVLSQLVGMLGGEPSNEEKQGNGNRLEGDGLD